jgi:two-component system OmpR family sensor kinase
MTLRARMVATLAALVSVLALLIGAAALITLQAYLTDQLHTQLQSAAGRSATLLPKEGDDGGAGRDPSHDGPSFLDQRGQAEGTLGATFTTEGDSSRYVPVEAGVIGTDGGTDPLSAGQSDLLAAVPADGGAHQVDLGGSLGSYLVTALRDERGGLAVVGLPMDGVQRTVRDLAQVVVLVGVAGAAVAALAGLVIVRLALRPLRRVAATATRVAQLPLERGDVALHERVALPDTDPRTEVGQVGAALNRMLGHIGQALAARTAGEARMRRFVADASHELRTPLASIRGYAELTRRRGGDLPADVRHALGRVESEAVRMTTLVEDLLLLARLDETAPAAGLRSDAVDLSQVVVDCLTDAHQLGPDHRWRLDLGPAPVSITGDDARLRQVVTNLLTNARVHTPPGTTITVRLSQHDGQGSFVLEVADDGPGVPPELQAAVFDRFARGDSSRSRAAGSTGLGLAIAASVVGAHGGELSVASRPGCTVFTVRLPRNGGQRPEGSLPRADRLHPQTGQPLQQV